MKERLSALYRARRVALEAEAEVLNVEDEADLVPLIREAIAEARSQIRHERSYRLQVLADLCGKVTHPGAIGLLLGILNDSDDSVRARAASVLGPLAMHRYPEVVRAALLAVDEGLEGPALLMLPGVLLDAAGDAPVPLDLLVRLLDHDDADVAAEAACALGEIDAPGVRELLESFREDDRRLSDVVEGPDTLGELIRDLLSTVELAEAVSQKRGDA